MSASLDPPLADYFWIAGIDSVSYGEHLSQDPKPMRKSFTEQLLVAIEAEEESSHSGHESLLVPGGGGSTSPRRSNGSLLSSSSRMSTASTIDEGSPPSPRTPLMRNGSNSSNSTITENSISGSGDSTIKYPPPRKDFDFDKALLKFAAERDSFLEDLSFSAGTVVPSKPLVHPRATIVVNEDPPRPLEKTN